VTAWLAEAGGEQAANVLQPTSTSRHATTLKHQGQRRQRSIAAGQETVALVLVVLILFAPLGALLGLIALILGIVGLVRANRGQADNAARPWRAW
jgi:hypothetical protein